jgi:4-amino-4-deoxy-L-arabinose transferase-like glycosyltransferase
MWREGNEILHAQSRYSRNLALARLGVIPFFLLAIAVVWVWTRRLYGESAALVAVLLFTTLPPVLGHAGMATTDVPLMGTFASALLAFSLCRRRMNLTRGALLGLSAALAILAKFSALVFLPAAALALVLCRWLLRRAEDSPRVESWGRTLKVAGVALLAAVLTIWAGYRFSVAPLSRASERPHRTIDRFLGATGKAHEVGYAIAENTPIPAPAFLMGLNRIRSLGSVGRESYLLGEIRQTGWWYYFPVAVGVKTPIPFLILALIGFGLLGHEAWKNKDVHMLEPAAVAAAVMVACVSSTVNIGVRHILPIYPFLAVLAGFAVLRLWKMVRYSILTRVAALGLLASQLGSSAVAHPDYLAYFNPLAGAHPDRVLVDSDLDWGQDLLRLSAELRQRGIQSLSIAYNGSADLDRHDLPPHRRLLPYEPTTGWIAISERKLKMGEGVPPFQGYSWLNAHEPVAVVGRSIRIYFIPESPREGPAAASMPGSDL